MSNMNPPQADERYCCAGIHSREKEEFIPEKRDWDLEFIIDKFF